MKQLILLIAVMLFMSLRAIRDPFWAVLMYYGFSVLRPQAIWEWALPSGIRWSFYAAIVCAAMVVIRPSAFSVMKASRSFIVCLAVLILLIGMSYFGAISRETAGMHISNMVKIAIMLIISAFAITSIKHIRYLAWMIFLCTLFIAYEVNFTYVFRGYNLRVFETGFGGYDNNNIALIAAMVIPFCWFFFFAEDRWRRWLYLICVFPLAHMIMLSSSRGAMLSTLVVSVGMILTTMKRHAMQTIVIAIAMFFILASLAGPQVRSRFATIGENLKDPSAQSRYMSWRAGVRIAHDYPFLGVGPRNSNLITKDYGADMQGRTIHNIYIQTAADSGLPAMIAFIALMVASMVSVFHTTSITRPHLSKSEIRWHHYICYAIFWAIVMFAIGSLFLSFESLELYYLLLLMAAVSPAVAIDAIRVSSPEDNPQLSIGTRQVAGLPMGDYIA
jgi:probable O-glycosylation ligase (exosortase A-associated)